TAGGPRRNVSTDDARPQRQSADRPSTGPARLTDCSPPPNRRADTTMPASTSSRGTSPPTATPPRSAGASTSGTRGRGGADAALAGPRAARDVNGRPARRQPTPRDRRHATAPTHRRYVVP